MGFSKNKGLGVGGNGAVVIKNIFVPSDFPTLAEANADLSVRYVMAEDVIDNDPIKTNTGQSFTKGQQAVWDGVSAYIVTDEQFWLDNGADLTPINDRGLLLADKRIKGVADPVDAQDAVNLQTLETKNAPFGLFASGMLEPVVFSFIPGDVTFDIAAKTDSIQIIKKDAGGSNNERLVFSSPALANVVPDGLGLSIRTFLYWKLTDPSTISLVQNIGKRADDKTVTQDNLVLFGIVVHSTLVSIDAVLNIGFFASQQGDAIKSTLDTLVAQELTEKIRALFYAADAISLQLKFSASATELIDGEILSDGGSLRPENRYINVVPAQDPVPGILLAWVNSSGLPQFLPSAVLNPANYQDGSDVLATVPDGTVTVQRLYYFSSGQKIAIYGIKIYESKFQALQNYQNEDWSAVENNQFFTGAILNRFVILPKTAANLIGDYSGATEDFLKDTTNTKGLLIDSKVPISISGIDVVNSGIVRQIVVIDEGGGSISWLEGEIYNETEKLPYEINSSGVSVALVNNATNFLKWVSGNDLSLSLTAPAGNEIGVSVIGVQAGDICKIIPTDVLTEQERNLVRALSEIFPEIVTGSLLSLTVEPDPDITSTLDLLVNSGTFWNFVRIENNVPTIYTRINPMRRHYLTAGVWTTETNSDVDTNNYNDGVNRVAIPANKWVKAGLAICGSNVDGFEMQFIYPTATYNNEPDALDALPPTLPPGLQVVSVYLATLTYLQGDTDISNATITDIAPRLGVSPQAFSGNPFNQSLNTTDSVSFQNVSTTNDVIVGRFLKHNGFTVEPILADLIGTYSLERSENAGVGSGGVKYFYNIDHITTLYPFEFYGIYTSNDLAITKVKYGSIQRQGIYATGDSDPRLRVAENNSAAFFAELVDINDYQARLLKQGNGAEPITLLDIDAIPTESTSDSKLRLGRYTNAANFNIEIFKADGSDLNKTIDIDAKAGNMVLGGDADPHLRVSEGYNITGASSTSSYMEIVDNNTFTGKLNKRATSTDTIVLLDINVLSTNATIDHKIRLFRDTNTTGNVLLEGMPGNGGSIASWEVNSANGTLELNRSGSDKYRVLSVDGNPSNDFEFFGLGSTSNLLAYSVANTDSDHIFYAGTSATTRSELARIRGEGGARFSGDVEIGNGDGYYIGDRVTNGSWREIVSGTDRLAQRRVSGTWVTKRTISGA